MLTAVLYDHVVELTARVGAAHDATADADPVTRLGAPAQAFYQGIREARDARRAVQCSASLLPETLGEPVHGMPQEALTASLLPALERLLSGVVFWGRRIRSHGFGLSLHGDDDDAGSLQAPAPGYASLPGTGLMAALAPAGVPDKSGQLRRASR
jgi:hypothetical protein